MEKQFNAGDRVRLKFTGSIVEVVIAKDGWIAYDENRKIAGSCPMEEVEPVDPKTAFLSELKGLLEKYNVCLISHKTDMPISVYFEGEEEPCVTIGKEVNKGCGVVVVTADNIMDYDKE